MQNHEIINFFEEKNQFKNILNRKSNISEFLKKNYTIHFYF